MSEGQSTSITTQEKPVSEYLSVIKWIQFPYRLIDEYQAREVDGLTADVCVPSSGGDESGGEVVDSEYSRNTRQRVSGCLSE